MYHYIGVKTWADINREEDAETRTETCGDCGKEFYLVGDDDKFCDRCLAKFYAQFDEDNLTPGK